MANLVQRLKLRPRLLIATALMAGVALLLLAFAGAGSDKDAEAWMTHTVTPEPFTIQQAFAGRIVPGEQVDIISPAGATVVEMAVQFGDYVEAGQLLFRLSEADVWRHKAEAQVGYLQAEETAQKLDDWENGPEVRRAKRSLEQAEIQYDEARRRQREGEGLFERGLIARTEMEGLTASLYQSGQSLQAARDELSETRSRGHGQARRIGQIQRGLAASRLAEADAASVIRAPRSGILVRPQRGALSGQAETKAGAKVTPGQTLGVIAAVDGLDVLFKVAESDLGLIALGTRATVTGPAFAGRVLNGTLLSVAGEAETGSTDRIMFAARIRLDPLSAEDTDKLRIGMTANVSLILYEAERALTVPVPALLGGATQVRVRKPDGTIEIRPIETGRIGPDRAEVLSGLKVGETVVWSPSA